MNPAQRLAARVAVSVFATSVVAAQLSITPLLSTGQPAPGFPEGATITTLNQPGVLDLLNEHGHTWAYGVTSGGGVTGQNDQGVWHISSSSVQLVWREGEPAPDAGPDIVFGLLGRVTGIASDDSLIIWAQLVGLGVTPANDSALYRVAAGAEPLLIIREGDQAPGLPVGTLMPPPRQMVRYRDNQIAWHGSVGSEFHIWASSPSGVEHLLGTGDAVPGFPDAIFSNPNVVPTLGGGDALGFTSRVIGGPPDGTTSLCRFHPEAGASVLLLSGQPAEGIGGGVTYSTIGISFNSGIGDPRGASSAIVVGPNVNSANNDVLYRLEDGGPVLSWREGDALPEIGDGVFFGSGASSTPTADAMYVSGQIIGAGIDAMNNATIWRTDGVTRTLIARESEPAADLPGDVLYNLFTFFSNDYSLVTNDAGRLMFVAGLRGNVSGENGSGVFVMDPLGQLRLAVRRGDTVLTPDGQIRTVTGFTAGGMNERGEVMLQLQYSGNTGSGLYLVRVGCPANGCEFVDIDGNCRVELQDLANLLAEFGSLGNALAADTDRDGDVDLQDLANLLAAFGNDCSGG